MTPSTSYNIALEPGILITPTSGVTAPLSSRAEFKYKKNSQGVIPAPTPHEPKPLKNLTSSLTVERKVTIYPDHVCYSQYLRMYDVWHTHILPLDPIQLIDRHAAVFSTSNQ